MPNPLTALIGLIMFLVLFFSYLKISEIHDVFFTNDKSVCEKINNPTT